MALDAAQLQLNAMLPVVAGSLFEAQELLGLDAGTQWVYMRDPDGNVVELIEQPSPDAGV
jgi:hypothetical protein